VLHHVGHVDHFVASDHTQFEVVEEREFHVCFSELLKRRCRSVRSVHPRGGRACPWWGVSPGRSNGSAVHRQRRPPCSGQQRVNRKTLEPAAAATPASAAIRRIRHHPPANVGWCSTG